MRTKVMWHTAIGIVVALAMIAGAAPGLAAGLAEPWQLGLQDSASPVMEKVHEFHTLMLVIQVAIVALVLGVLAYVIVRFNAKRNPVPSKTAHNTLLEIVWTAVPIVILVVIAIPSIKLLYFADKTQDYEMTLKITGHQWYWSYAYPDHGDFQFDSIPVADDDLQPGQPRLLSVDNRIVLPVNTKIQLLITADDVIHNWAIPALGLKADAVPGRTNETWVEITREGDYYGMCSELCGINHGYMPIHVEAVSKEAFAVWVKEATEKFASSGAAPVVAAAARN
jgi:cytochrome c oxidase subunit 2